MSDRPRSKLFFLIPPLLALALALPGVSSACGGTGGSGKIRPDGGPLCQQGTATCAAGTLCNNGNCVATCATDGTGCAADQFCEGTEAARLVCTSIERKACTIAQDCPLPQSCQSGLCVSIELRRDGGYNGCLLGSLDDGCAGEAICLQNTNSQGQTLNNCIGMPGCGQDGGCPVGNIGSTCNDQPDGGRLLPAKQRVCLLGLCAGGPDCPPNAGCFRPKGSSPLGQCQSGTLGDLCFVREDCPNANVCTGADGGLDDGGAPGRCQ